MLAQKTCPPGRASHIQLILGFQPTSRTRAGAGQLGKPLVMPCFGRSLTLKWHEPRSFAKGIRLCCSEDTIELQGELHGEAQVGASFEPRQTDVPRIRTALCFTSACMFAGILRELGADAARCSQRAETKQTAWHLTGKSRNLTPLSWPTRAGRAPSAAAPTRSRSTSHKSKVGWQPAVSVLCRRGDERGTRSPQTTAWSGSTPATEVDKLNRTVTLDQVQLTKVNFPAEPGKNSELTQLLEAKLPNVTKMFRWID